jgi:SRSO17 transposase
MTAEIQSQTEIQTPAAITDHRYRNAMDFSKAKKRSAA